MSVYGKGVKLFAIIILIFCLVKAAFYVKAAEDEIPSLAQGQYIRWRDRVVLPDYAKEFYAVCVEAADNDGYHDFFIPASNESSGCLQTFGDCREGQIPRPLGRSLGAFQIGCSAACGGVFDSGLLF